MKRSPELRDLSEEHHYGLVAARNLRLAAEGDGPVVKAAEAFLVEWQGAIQPHFQREEEVLLPQFAAVAGAEHELVARTLAEHAALRSAVEELSHADAAERRPLAAQVGQLLHDHIRFEERVLFPAVEAHLAGSGLQHLGETLKALAGARNGVRSGCRVTSSLSSE